MYRFSYIPRRYCCSQGPSKSVGLCAPKYCQGFRKTDTDKRA
jgi:hypothetical protein